MWYCTPLAYNKTAQNRTEENAKEIDTQVWDRLSFLWLVVGCLCGETKGSTHIISCADVRTHPIYKQSTTLRQNTSALNVTQKPKGTHQQGYHQMTSFTVYVCVFVSTSHNHFVKGKWRVLILPREIPRSDYIQINFHVGLGVVRRCYAFIIACA